MCAQKKFCRHKKKSGAHKFFFLSTGFFSVSSRWGTLRLVMKKPALLQRAGLGDFKKGLWIIS
ncbi:hypothetical protein EDL98_00945 [Ornithobacterium rhinotracheale]|nr:hypothetical protein [Ornithobacterium rhinotracheale]